jgi:hypothetical protein
MEELELLPLSYSQEIPLKRDKKQASIPILFFTLQEFKMKKKKT